MYQNTLQYTRKYVYPFDLTLLSFQDNIIETQNIFLRLRPYYFTFVDVMLCRVVKYLQIIRFIDELQFAKLKAGQEKTDPIIMEDDATLVII